MRQQWRTARVRRSPAHPAPRAVAALLAALAMVTVPDLGSASSGSGDDGGAASLTAEAARPIPGLPFDGQPTFDPVAVLAPTSANPWLLVGTERLSPGLPTGPAVFVADPAASATWARGGRARRPADESVEVPYVTSDAVALPDGTAVVLGSAERADGWVAVTWSVEDGELSEPVDVGAPIGSQFVSGAAAVTADGEVLAALDDPAGGWSLGRRDSSGEWDVSDLDVDADAFDLRGVAAIGDTVVVVGAASGGAVSSPAAYVSTDGGDTFATADTSTIPSVSFAGELSAVVATSGGFLAGACIERNGALLATLVESADGSSWTEVAGVAPATAAAGGAPACGEVVLDPGGGVWHGRSGGQTGELLRHVDGQTSSVLTYAVAPGTELARSAALTASDGAITVAAVPTFGGVALFTGSVAPAPTPTPAALTQVVSPNPGRPTFAGIDARDDRGGLAYVLAFPQLVALGDGTTTWATQTRSFMIGDDGTAIADDAANVVDLPESRGRALVVTLPASQLAIVNRSEFDPAADPGASGDVAMLSRPVGGSWSAPAAMVETAGDQFVVAATVAGATVVAAGRELSVDPATGATTSTPLILVGDGSAAFQRVAIPPEAADLIASAVCPLADGRALVVGRSAASGAWLTATVDPAALAATVAPASIDVADDDLLVDCALNSLNASRPLVARSGTGVYASADGVTWEAVYRSEAGWRLQRLVVGPAGVAAVENTDSGGSDLRVWFGATVDELVEVASPQFAGPGDQEAVAASVRADAVLVYGSINERPVVWRIAVPA